MKTKSIIIIGTILLSLSLALSSFIRKTPSATNQQRTEEYAIVDVIQTGKRKTIRITKGTQPGIETDWGKIDTEKRDDYTPVINVLNQLNEEGYELLNASLAYSSVSGGQNPSWGDPRHTFMMVKKIK